MWLAELDLDTQFNEEEKEAIIFCVRAPNGWRYPLVGGTRQHHFAGTSLEPRKLPKNAQTPTSRVHAVLGALTELWIPLLKRTT